MTTLSVLNVYCFYACALVALSVFFSFLKLKKNVDFTRKRGQKCGNFIIKIGKVDLKHDYFFLIVNQREAIRP